jgi:hypothetical protein
VGFIPLVDEAELHPMSAMAVDREINTCFICPPVFSGNYPTHYFYAISEWRANCKAPR